MLKRLSRRFSYLAAISSLALLAGCGSLLKSDFHEPQVTVPADWRAAATTSVESSTRVIDQWWKDFNDPALDALVELALQKNNDLAAATLKVRQAQLEVGLAENEFLPSFSGGGDATRQTDMSRSSATTSGSSSSRTSTSYSVSGGVSWELDLWGRIARETDAADWEAQATQQDRDETALSLVGTVVELYWQLGYLSERIALSDESIAYSQKTLELVKAQHGAGAASGLEEAEAIQSLASQQASRTQLVEQQQEVRNALAILFDGPPGTDHAEPVAMPEEGVPQVDAGLPAQVLERRPDIQAAELRLRETLATGDATKASYFPTISLTGSLGSSSIALSDLVKNPIGTLGADLVLPFLNINEMLLNIKVSKVEYQTAVVNYRQTLYTALKDVENALSARQQYAEQGALLEASLAAAEKAESLYEAQYRAGAVALKSWLDAQETRRTAQEAVAENQFNRILNYVTLCQALGGGPKLTEVAQAE